MFEVLAIFGGSFAVALSGAMMPGPLLTVTVAEATKRGFSAGPLLITGHALLELALVVAIILGLGPFLKINLVMGIISLVGGAMLMWLGLDMLRSAGSLSLNQGANAAKPAMHPLLMGVLASLANPYWILWWATIGLGYLISTMKLGALGVAIFFLGHIAGDYFWYGVVSYGISRGKSILKDRSYQAVIRCCGVFLLGFGGWFLFSAKTYLTSQGTL